jgi:Mn2+/Fe2+ NRAMP family transporter
MGPLVNRGITTAVTACIALLITALNFFLLYATFLS